jgi:hypothetical protein
MAKGKKTGGRVANTPNKATADARQAIAAFVDGNAHRLTEWLDAVANGDESGEVKPNPAKAFELFQSVVEYHIPKLARTDATISGPGGGPVESKWSVEVVHVAKAPDTGST